MVKQDYKGNYEEEDIPFLMQHTIQQLIQKINAMHDKAIELHRLRNPLQ